MLNVAKKPPKPLLVQDPATLPGKNKSIGGSQHDGWNLVIANQTLNSLRPIADEEVRNEANTATLQH
jgi:hypothetical protein